MVGLRQKLEKVSPDWRYIHTHFWIGYRFAAERSHSAVPVLEAVLASGTGATLAEA